jgi:adenylosuccinate lyase/3-carboxy-cis,cis-muconate cycloisomerase
VRARYATLLELAEPPREWHAARDRVRDLGHALAQLAGVAERIGTEIVRLQATEVAEVREPAAPGHVGSSTMPQKRNPMTCEYVIASARLLQGSVVSLLTSSDHAGERDMGRWAVEWIAVPQALILAGGIASKLAGVLEGLEVDTTRMRSNLALTRGVIMAEAVMMALARSVGHEEAHRIVAAASARALAEERPFGRILAEDELVTRYLQPEALDGLLDPERYLGEHA